MEDNPAQNINQQQHSTVPGIAGMKVIQPSTSLVEEMKVSQPASAQPQPISQTISSSLPTANSQPDHTAVAPSSIYPEATKGVNTSTPSSTPAIQANEARPTDPKKLSKVLIVRIAAGAIIALNAINAYNWFLERRAGYTSWINIIGICVVLTLTVGIFMLSEVARAAYVFLSAVLLVLSCIGLIMFYASTHNNASFQANARPLTQTQIENSIKAAERNTSMSPQARQEVIQQLQKQLNQATGSPVELKVKQYLSTGLLIATAVGPLIFFTRPSIKEIFT